MVCLQSEDNVQIPYEFNLVYYPMSFSYYDHIFSYILSNINKNHLNFMRVKTKMDMFFNDTRSLQGMLGLKKFEQKIQSKGKMKLQLTKDINKKDNNINHTSSKHT